MPGSPRAVPTDLVDAIAAICTLIAQRAPAHPAPLVVALDGQSGTGKSTLARLVADTINAAVVPLDDFFAASIPSAQWDAWSPADRARHVVDWARVRRDVLEPLRRGQPARWHAFDFAAGTRADGTYGFQQDTVTCEPRPVVLLDGAYSASPPLADLIDVAILVEALPAEREERLRAREEAAFLAAWHARWDAVEEHYANVIRPRASFDLVVSTSETSSSQR